MRQKVRIIVFLIILFIILLSEVVQPVKANNIDITANIGDKAYLDKGIQGFYTIQKKKADGNWTYIIYSIIKYKDTNGDEHVAYCLDENKFGVGYVNGDVDGYEVELTKLISNEKVWRVIINGYPYKTPEQLGVETEDDAYLATKRAIYSIIKGYTEKDVRENYRVGQKSINGQDLEDIQRRGEKVITAICKLVNIGNNGTQKIDNEIKIVKLGELEENKEDNSYYQKYKVESTIELSSYTITEMLNFPEGTKVVDENGEERKTFSANEEFTIIINKEIFEKDIEGAIKISAKCKTYPIYYGTAPAGYQDYAICSGYWDNLYSSTILIAKKPKEPEQPIQPEEPIIPEEPGEPEQQEPEMPSEPLPRTGEDGVVERIVESIAIMSMCITSLLLYIIRKYDKIIRR